MKSLKISGFKSLGTAEAPAEIEFGRINVIIGPNGAGKSNLISFFEMLFYMMTGTLQGYIGKKGSAEALLGFGSKATSEISAALTFENNAFVDQYAFCLRKSDNDALFFFRELIGNDELGSGHKESLLLSEGTDSVRNVAVKSILFRFRTFQFHDTSPTSHIRNSAKVEQNRYLMSDGGNVAAFLYMLRERFPLYYGRIVKHIRYVMPSFGNFCLEPSMLNPDWIRLEWREEGKADYIFGPESLSDGMLRFIALAALLLSPPELLPSVILLDEPELGLHPQAVDILAEMVRTAGDHTQIIIATQSERLVDNFDIENILVAEKNEHSHLTEFYSLKDMDIEQWLEDYTISQIWEKNVFGGQP